MFVIKNKITNNKLTLIESKFEISALIKKYI